MKIRLITLFLILLWFSSCSMSIKRIGLSDPSSAPVDPSCQPTLVKGQKIDSARAQMLGTVQIYDPGLVTTCDEATVQAILLREACAQHSNLVNITKEHNPNYGTCYQVEADLYTTTHPDSQRSANAVPPQQQISSEQMNPMVYVLAAVLGFAFGYFFL